MLESITSTTLFTPDMINGIFELVGAVVLWFNVVQIRKDKRVKGMNPWTTVFFSAWGFWNLYYYPSLDQWMSFFGGLAIVSVNLIWLIHVFYYKLRRENLYAIFISKYIYDIFIDGSVVGCCIRKGGVWCLVYTNSKGTEIKDKHSDVEKLLKSNNIKVVEC